VGVTEPPKLAAQLEHSSHGRIRVRVPRHHRTEAALRRVQSQLEAQAAVSQVTVNARSGSVLVEGDHTDTLRRALYEVLDIFERAGPEGAPEAGVETAVSLVKGVDQRLMELTDGKLSLRWLVPAGFITVGIRQLLAQGLTLGTVPWYVLIYYGLDSFLKLYPEHAPHPRPRLEVLTKAGIADQERPEPAGGAEEA
jgi:Heavy metal associated domain 2